MPLYINGTNIPNTGNVNFNGTSLTKVIFNNVTVWEKQTTPTSMTFISGSAFQNSNSYTQTYHGIPTKYGSYNNMNFEARKYGDANWVTYSGTTIKMGVAGDSRWNYCNRIIVKLTKEILAVGQDVTVNIASKINGYCAPGYCIKLMKWLKSSDTMSELGTIRAYNWDVPERWVNYQNDGIVHMPNDNQVYYIGISLELYGYYSHTDDDDDWEFLYEREYSTFDVQLLQAG